MGGRSPLGMLGIPRFLTGTGSGPLLPGMGREGMAGMVSSEGICGVGGLGLPGRWGRAGPPGGGTRGNSLLCTFCRIGACWPPVVWMTHNPRVM